MLLLQWTALLGASLFVLLKGADLFIDGASKIGTGFGLSSFAVGVLIVGFGTSLPELATSLAAVFSGAPEIVIANAVGSNIANILFIVGLLAFLAGPIMIKQDLIKTELPLFFIATLHFGAALYDGVIDRLEAVLLLATFGAYVWYILVESRSAHDADTPAPDRSNLTFYTFMLTGFGLLAVLVGAKYAIDMTVLIATELSVPLGLVSIGAIAFGTSLPELFVTIQAIRSKKTEMAIGNIFGSNSINLLFVVGLPGLFISLTADAVVMQLGFGIMLAASAILFVSGLARQIMRWEGLMMLVFFAFFVIKLTTFI